MDFSINTDLVIHNTGKIEVDSFFNFFFFFFNPV